MLATTPEKAILRLLYFQEIGDKTKSDPGNLEILYKYLVNVDQETGEELYGLSSLIGPEYEYGDEPNLMMLHEMKMVDYNPGNPHAKLTPLGRALANLVRFPDELDDLIRKAFDNDLT